jgi:hypothetical protein
MMEQERRQQGMRSVRKGLEAQNVFRRTEDHASHYDAYSLPTGKWGVLKAGTESGRIVALFATPVVLPVLALLGIAKVTNL